MTADIPAWPAFSEQNTYQYSTKDELTQEQSTRAGGYTNVFGYDLAGNPTNFKGTSHSYNANNQDTGNVYDLDGNPTVYRGSVATYDVENHLTSVGATALTACYRADGLLS